MGAREGERGGGNQPQAKPTLTTCPLVYILKCVPWVSLQFILPSHFMCIQFSVLSLLSKVILNLFAIFLNLPLCSLNLDIVFETYFFLKQVVRNSSFKVVHISCMNREFKSLLAVTLALFCSFLMATVLPCSRRVVAFCPDQEERDWYVN